MVHWKSDFQRLCLETSKVNRWAQQGKSREVPGTTLLPPVTSFDPQRGRGLTKPLFYHYKVDDLRKLTLDLEVKDLGYWAQIYTLINQSIISVLGIEF